MNERTGNGRRGLRRVGYTAALLIGYYVINLAASLCFREGGTDGAHRLFYFIIGNALGITSTVLLMGLYARMQINLALLLVTSGSFTLVQFTFWLVYHSALTWAQVLGIVLVGVGTIMATRVSQAPAVVGPAAATREEIH